MDQMHDLPDAEKWSLIDGPTVSGDVPDNWRQATDLGINGVLTNRIPESRGM
jgi:hypothetical protein